MAGKRNILRLLRGNAGNGSVWRPPFVGGRAINTLSRRSLRRRATIARKLLAAED